MCVELIRGMGPLEAEYEKKGVAFLLVNGFEDEAKGRAFMAAEGKDRPWAFADEAALKTLGIHVAPTQVLVDREGRVAWTSDFSSISEGVPAFRRALEKVVAGK
jgi:hypothetical protein